MGTLQRRNFIEDFVALNEGTEIPSIFALWCGMTGISAALGRRVFLDMGTYTIFCNVYTVLVASSGRHRKSTAIKQVERIMRKMQPPPNIVAQKITPEALIEAIKVVETSDGVHFLREKCEGLVCADELATFLNKASYEAGLASLLIPLYDCVEAFDYHTKGRGKEQLTNTCLSLLAASTVDWIRNGIPEEAVGGGLTSRIMFVYVDEPGKPVAITQFSKEKEYLFAQCIQTLQHISTLHGTVTLTAESWEMYVSEYESFYSKSPFYDDRTLSGYASRRHMHLLKLAMLFSVAEGDDLIVTIKHMNGAKALLQNTESHLRSVMQLITASEGGSHQHMILGLMAKSGSIARSRLLALVGHRMSSRDLTDAIETLVHSRQIDVVAAGADIVYRLIAKPKDS